MRKIIKKWTTGWPLLLVTGLLFSLPGAQAAPTLAESITAAIERNPRASIPAARSQLGQGYERQAGSWFGDRPSFNLVYKTDQLTEQEGYRELEAALDLPMWNPGQRKALKNLSDSIQAQAGSDERLLAWEVSSQVFEYAWQLKLAEQETTLSKELWESNQVLEEDIQKRVDAGELPRSDALMARQQTTQLHDIYEQAILAEANARSAWRLYTGNEQLPFDLMDIQIQETGSSDPHPQIENSDLAVQSAQANSRSEHQNIQGNPSLILYARRDRAFSFEPYDNALGIGVTLPFATESLGAGKVAEAEMLLTEAMADQAEIRRNLVLLQEQSRQELESAKRRLDLAKQQYEIARSRVKLTQRAFDLGESGVFLLLQAREEAAKAADHLARSRITYYQSISRYNLSLGVIPE